jgi:DNA-binding response OmpR family regulator
MKMLNGALVLVAEDQPFIAMELGFAVEDAGGVVVGPAASVQTALALIKEQSIAAAILDFNLIDGDATPIIALLSASNIPIIIQTGIGLMPELMLRFPGLIVFTKPNNPEELIAKLGMLVGSASN